MQRKVVIAVLALVLVLGAFGSLILTACGSDSGDTGAREESSAPAAAATGEPIKIGFDEGFTGFMAVDADMTDKGIQLALEQLGNQIAGRPVEYIKADNGSDPVQAVDKARQLVESDKIDVMIGPIFSPANAAVTDYLAKNGGIPSISIYGQPIDNMKTANGLSFVPSGLFSFAGYMTGKYAAEEMGWKTANCINYEDTAGRQLQEGFNHGFEEAGGKILSTQFVPIDAVDFSSYLTSLKDADCTYWWIFGNGAAPFVKQYKDYGLTAPLITAMASNLTEPQLADLGEAALGLIGGEFYTPEIDNPLNKEFVAAYNEMYDGEYPTMQSFGAWLAVNLFAGAVEANGGDTTPAKLIEAMSTVTIDTPAGPYKMSEYEDMYVGTGSYFMMETKQVGDRIAWVPVFAYDDLLHEQK
jgi:branched-chain amino acid transport system substrate-binding protein